MNIFPKLISPVLIAVLLFGISSPGLSTAIPGWKEALFYHLAPEKLASPQITEIPTVTIEPSPLKRRKPTMVIFSVGLSSGYAHKPTEVKSFQKISQKILKVRLKLGLLNYQKIYLNESVFHKKKEAYESKWIELVLQKNALKNAILWHEGQELRNNYYKIARHLSHPWRYHEASTTGSILRAIHQEPIRHVVIVGHGDENGFLYDSERNPFHLSFFKNLPPWVQSVSFFACHPQKMKSLYLKSMESGSSWYQKRYLLTLNEHKHLLEKGEVWSGGFPDFMRHLDKFVSKIDHDLQQAQFTVNSDLVSQSMNFTDCRLSIKGLRVLEGQWEATLNRQWIGALDKFSSTYGMNFKCPIIPPPDQALRLSIYPVNQSWEPTMLARHSWSVKLLWHGVEIPILSSELQQSGGENKPQSIRVEFARPEETIS